MSLLWFKERILVFLWKLLYFRWPGNPAASRCSTWLHHSFQMQWYSWRYLMWGPHVKPRTSVSEFVLPTPPLPFCNLFFPSALSWFLNSKSDFPNTGCHLPLPKFGSALSGYGRFWHFYQSFRFQVTDMTFKSLETIFFSGFCLKSMWLWGRLLSSFKRWIK